MKHIACVLIGALGWLASTLAPAEVFLLKNGGRVEGEWVNRDEKSPATYSIKLGDGGEISLEAEQVKEVVGSRADLAEYDQVRAKQPDTVAGHWKMAQWCGEHHLPEQQNQHLQRIIELDPSNAEARHALGYKLVNNEWKTEDEVARKDGRVLYKGRYRLPQEIEMMEAKDDLKKTEAQWFQEIKRCRQWLNDKPQQARANLAAINDPAAVRALESSLKDEQKKGRPAVRVLLVEVLARLGTNEAIRVLATAAVDDPDEEVRLSCLDYLEKKPNPEVVAYFVKRLKEKKNRDLMCHAAVALGRMKDPSAIGPLVDHLITFQKVQVGASRPAGAMSMGFSKDGNGPVGMGAGGSGAKVVNVATRNQAVLDALVAITGQNFDFEPSRWSRWLQTQKRPAGAVDTRRD